MHIMRAASLLGALALFLGSSLFPFPAYAAGKTWKVALVLPGSIHDQGFNEVAYRGLQEIQKNDGAQIAFSENTPMANYERVIRGFAEDGNDIIICRGLEFGELALKIAPDYPNQYFIVSDGHEVSGPNVISIEPRTRDGAFLAGILAGLTTKTGKVGAIIGFDYPLLVGDVEAFRWAMRSVNPKAELQVIYLGTFDDVTKGKEAALVQINAGCDIIYHIADTAALGIFQAAEENKIKVIGYGSDQNHVSPKTIYATEIADPRYMMSTTVGDIMNHRFDGKARVYGLDTPSVDLAIAPGFVSPEIMTQVGRWKKAIADGELVIPLMTQQNAGYNPAPAQLKTP